MKRLENQVALVTGGASGLGRAIVERFVAEGARVTVLDRSAEGLADLRAALGDTLLGIQGDVTIPAHNVRAVDQTLEKFGRLDCVIGNAGLWDYKAPLADLSLELLGSAFDELFSVNVKAYVLLARAALKPLVASRGSLIYTASNAAFQPDGGGVLYTASKHAVRGIVAQLAYELAPYVRVNAVAPGGIATKLTGLKSLGQAEARLPGDLLAEWYHQASPIKQLPAPADYTGAYVFFAARQDNLPATGAVLRHDGGLGLRGFADGRGGDSLPGKLGLNELEIK